jgi:hypothetical protein
MSDNAAIVLCLAIIVLGVSSCEAVSQYSHAKYPAQKCLPESEEGKHNAD